jgi:hypothetical protein
VTPRPVLLGSGLAALALAFPGLTPPGVALTVLGLVVLWPAVTRPGSQAPTLLLAVVLVGWLVIGADAGAPRLIGLVVAVAVVHFSAALAAVTPPRTPVHRRVLRRWAVRCAGAVAGGLAALAVVGLLPAPPLPAWTTTAAVVAVTAGVLAVAVGATRAGRAEEPPG